MARKLPLPGIGYFSTTQRNRRGRQLGRVLATRYEEVVTDRLFPGNQQLGVSLQELMQAAQTTLELTQEQRGRCLVRVDAGGGSVPNLNWLLERDYHILGKACSGQQARLLAKTVQQWITDPHLPERQCGWVTEEPTAFARPVRRLAVRCPKPNGQWGIGVLICSLSDQEILCLAGATLETTTAGEAVMLALMSLYDQRGGGIETSFKGDKGGLGLTKRNKKRGSRAATGDAVGIFGAQCHCLGKSLAHPADVHAGGIPGSCDQEPLAPLRHLAHGSRCVSHQRLSAF